MASKVEHDELCTAYAAMALFDGDAEVSASQIKALISATGNEVEPYWPMLFARQDIGKLVFALGSGGGGGGGGDAAAGGGGDAPAEEKKEEEKEEEEEVDMAGGMDMFGGEGGGGDDY
jgi:ribosomal protein L12E/L44/L45/RPP1/RPP2